MAILRDRWVYSASVQPATKEERIETHLPSERLDTAVEIIRPRNRKSRAL